MLHVSVLTDHYQVIFRYLGHREKQDKRNRSEHKLIFCRKNVKYLAKCEHRQLSMTAFMTLHINAEFLQMYSKPYDKYLLDSKDITFAPK